VLATTNAGKAAEFRRLLGSRFSVQTLDELAAASGSKPPEVEETGESYYENALKKALRYFAWQKTVAAEAGHPPLPVLADDSGIELDALGGLPGVYSARFGGEDLGWPARWQHLQDELQTTGPGPWPARFRCVLCYYDGLRPPLFYEGTTEGSVIPAAKGTAGFGYDPIFYSDALGATFGEASEEKKDAVSHRARALASFVSAVESRE
jgi:XTP/dITP diphosphohydrolase